MKQRTEAVRAEQGIRCVVVEAGRTALSYTGGLRAVRVRRPIEIASPGLTRCTRSIGIGVVDSPMIPTAKNVVMTRSRGLSSSNRWSVPMWS